MFFSVSKSEGAVAHRPLSMSETTCSLRRGVPMFPEGADISNMNQPNPIITHRDLMGVLTNQGTVKLFTKNVAEPFAECQPANKDGKGIKDFYFSPLTNFLVTYEAKSSEDNVRLFFISRATGLHLIDSVVLSKYTPATFPLYKWSASEEYCCKLISTGVCVYDLTPVDLKHGCYVEQILETSDDQMIHPLKNEVFKTSKKISVPKCAHFELSNSCEGFGSATSSRTIKNGGPATSSLAGGNALISKANMRAYLEDVEYHESKGSVSAEPVYCAVFLAEAKGQPAKVMVYDLAHVDTCVSSKSFFNAQSCDILWNYSKPPACVVLSHSDSDKSGETYYGVTSGFHISVSGDSYNLEQVQAAAWNPRKNELLLLSGHTLPAELQILHGSKPDKVIKTYGKHRRNTLLWNPSGKGFIAAGFGNLPGDMDFYWDGNLIRTLNFHCCVTLEFTPCGRFLLAASTAPRVKKDNAVRLYNWAGSMLLSTEQNTLNFQDIWKEGELLYTHFLSFFQYHVTALADLDLEEDCTPAMKTAAAEEGLASPGGMSSSTSSNGLQLAFNYQSNKNLYLENIDFNLKTLEEGKKQGNDAGKSPTRVYVPPNMRAGGAGSFGIKRPGSTQSTASNTGGMARPPSGGGKGNKAQQDSSPKKKQDKQQGGDKQQQQSGGKGPDGSAGKADLIAEVSAITSPDEKAKKVKNLRKKLGQIENLKGKASINPEEQEKLASEGTILSAIKILES